MAWLPFLFLATIDARFNAFNHSLHNDGLALLISVAAFWIIVRHSLVPKTWHLAFMVILPVAGFLVKQSLLIWIGIFPFYLLFSGLASRRALLAVLLSSSLLSGGVIALAMCSGATISCGGTSRHWGTKKSHRLGASS